MADMGIGEAAAAESAKTAAEAAAAEGGGIGAGQTIGGLTAGNAVGGAPLDAYALPQSYAAMEPSPSFNPISTLNEAPAEATTGAFDASGVTPSLLGNAVEPYANAPLSSQLGYQASGMPDRMASLLSAPKSPTAQGLLATQGLSMLQPKAPQAPQAPHMGGGGSTAPLTSPYKDMPYMQTRHSEEAIKQYLRAMGYPI